MADQCAFYSFTTANPGIDYQSGHLRLQAISIPLLIISQSISMAAGHLHPANDYQSICLRPLAISILLPIISQSVSGRWPSPSCYRSSVNLSTATGYIHSTTDYQSICLRPLAISIPVSTIFCHCLTGAACRCKLQYRRPHTESGRLQNQTPRKQGIQRVPADPPHFPSGPWESWQ